AEDGIRDFHVTGVQTCALPILLKVFGRATPALGITELAARVGLHKSTAYRLAATLAGEGFLRQDPTTGRYSLGESLYRVAAGFRSEERRVGKERRYRRDRRQHK